MDKRTKKTLSDEALLLRVRKYCALRERSIKEVNKKLLELGAMEDKAQLMIEKLKEEGFLNEKRYVSAYTRGKFRNKKWGKKKIEMELKRQGINKEMLEKGLGEIETTDYVQTLDALLLKKWKQIKAKTPKDTFSDNDLFTPAMQKLINYAMQKGFEYDVIIDRVKKIL
ncbi:MAG TPA: regulatory protein RecX [Bacteroidia bacterium]|nr:regulatory protein RecX [Bacteroidia bacterium]